MATIIICTALLVEIVLTAYCIKSKAYQIGFKSFIRIGAFIGFIALTLFSIVEWGRRWYGLAFLLFIWAMLGVVALLHGNKKEKPYKRGRLIRRRILAFLLIVIVTVPAVIFPQYTLPNSTGEFKVATSVYTYTDDSRLETYTNSGEKRQVTVEFWYPQNAEGKYPLVLFTHGLFGIAMSNESTYKELASNGYIVGSVSHPYISMYSKTVDGKTIIVSGEYMKETSVFNSDAGEDLIYDAFAELQKVRVADVNFVLDTVLCKAGEDDPVYRLIDVTKLGLFGHSMGGATMSAVSRTRNDIGAVVNLDAPLFGELSGLQNGHAVLREDIYPIPLLNVYSDDLWELMEPDPMYAGNVRLLSDPPDYVINIHINGAKHLSFTDLSLASPILADILQGGKAKIKPTYCLEIMNKAILEFFDSFLKDIDNI